MVHNWNQQFAAAVGCKELWGDLLAAREAAIVKRQGDDREAEAQATAVARFSDFCEERT